MAFSASHRPVAAAVLGIVVAFAVPAWAKGDKAGKGGDAAGIGKAGCVELGLAGLYDMDPDDATAAYLDLSVGYFLLDGIAAGVTTLNGTTRAGQRDTNGVFMEYDYVFNDRFIPFFGNAFKHAAPPAGSDGEDAQIFGIYGGVKLGLGAAAALSATLKWEFATEPVLGPADGRKRRNRELELGLKLYF